MKSTRHAVETIENVPPLLMIADHVSDVEHLPLILSLMLLVTIHKANDRRSPQLIVLTHQFFQGVEKSIEHLLLFFVVTVLGDDHVFPCIILVRMMLMKRKVCVNATLVCRPTSVLVLRTETRIKAWCEMKITFITSKQPLVMHSNSSYPWYHKTSFCMRVCRFVSYANLVCSCMEYCAVKTS